MLDRVLVTGGAGFVGSNFVRFLLASDRSACIFNLDGLTYAGSLENLRDLPDPERHTFIQGDVCDEALTLRLLSEHYIDTIVNFAAESHVDRSILKPQPFVRSSVTGVFSVLEADRLGAEFIHYSTDYVFDGSKDRP